MSGKTPYELLGKEEGVRALAKAVYEAMDELPEAETIRQMHNESLVDIQQKLFEYLNGWLGGPHLYKQKYGKVCLMDQHKPFAIGEAERDQWLLCFDKALDKVNAPDEVRNMVREPIFSMANFLVNQR
ncbi:MAG TPA: group II truncated hemoglobin [Pseudomonadales bacterium]